MKLNKNLLFFLTIVLVISLNFFFISCSSQPTYSPKSESRPIEVTPTPPPPPETKTVGAWCYNPNYSAYCSTCRNLESGADSDVIQGCRLLNDENHCQGCGI